MVKDIEELGTKPESDFIRKLKQSLCCHIRLPRSETSQHVTTKIPLCAGGRRSKSCPIEDLATGILRPEDFKRHSWLQVWAWSQGDAGHKEGSANNVNWRS